MKNDRTYRKHAVTINNDPEPYKGLKPKLKIIALDESTEISAKAHQAIIDLACRKIMQELKRHGITLKEFLEWHERQDIVKKALFKVLR
jgi:TRAP-type C4-dicarboxylate transport system substrate-binding protein